MRETAVVIPACNEELTLPETLASAAKLVPREDIYLISDGSTDGTVLLALGEAANCVWTRRNLGKSEALRQVISSFRLASRYRYVLFLDADSVADPAFLRRALAEFRPGVACVVGRVDSRPGNWLVTHRRIEYAISHRIYKRAQSDCGMVLIAPGCASVYRADCLPYLEFSGRTVTEDFDLTLQVYRKRLGTVVFCPEAVIYTQDPNTLTGYLRQVNRWYKGWWQNFRLHGLPFGRQRVDLEAGLLAADGLAYPVGLAGAALLFRFKPTLALAALVTDFLVYAAFVLTYGRGRHAWPVLLMLLPAFYALRVLNAVLFSLAFFRGRLSHRRVSWQRVARY